jgi:hypothetical protein
MNLRYPVWGLRESTPQSLKTLRHQHAVTISSLTP